jgi:hypothetical protein
MVTPFGDGPDGGREATFDGPTDYGPARGKWSGYGVIQAKFLQRSVSTNRDGSWALSQLRSELRKYNASKVYRKPDYYIFATNVSLTPPAARGSKDRIIQLLEDFAGSQGLKGYDVWDYDKLRIMIDNNQDVRRAYAAWITPGDVLSDLASWLSGQRADYHTLLINFLQKELLADQYAKLEQAGHSADESIPLANVFVDLPTGDRNISEPPKERPPNQRNRMPNFVEMIIGASALHLRIHSSDVPSRTSTEFSPKAHGRYVLIGGPGQGKTTVGQFICQLFRTALLDGVEDRFLDISVKQAVELIKLHCAKDNLALPQSRRLPFRVVLSEFATRMASEEVLSLLEYLARGFNRRTNAQLSVRDFRQLLVSYPCVLILDGLDEVPASTNREQVLGAVREFWIDVASSGIDALVIATSRPQGYNDDFSPSLYQHRWLVPLSVQRALEYAQRLTEVRFGSDPDRVDKVVGRLRRAAESPATARLMRSPLQVTIMTLLVDRMGQPPQERWALFREYYNLIYQREIEREIPAAAILKEYRTDIDSVHRHVALLLQVESERSGSTDARMTPEQLGLVVERHLTDEGHTGASLEELKDAIIEGAANRLVFLVGLETGQVGFEVRSLQEFMAAEGLMDADDQTTQARLREIAGNYNWRNVFLFAAGRVFSDRRYLRDTIESICLDLNDHPDDGLLRSILAGSELALDLLQDGSVTRQPAKGRALTRLALQLLRLPSDGYHRRLADTYQASTADIFRQELEAALNDKGGAGWPGAWECLASLVESGAGEEFDELARLHIGDIKSERAVFQVLLTNTQGKSWLANQLVEAVPFHPPDILIQAGSQRDRTYHDNEDLGPWPTPPWPDWFAAAHEFTGRMYPAQTRRGQMLRVGLAGPRSEYGTFSLMPLEGDGRREKIFSGIARMPMETDEWAVIRSIAEFSKAPGKLSLAKALREAKRVGVSDRTLTRARTLPWPLAACLEHRGTDSLSDLANTVESGGLGDIEDWRSAERRWLDRGISIEDLLAMGATSLPFGADIAKIGFPYQSATFYVANQRSAIAAFQRAYRSASPPRIKGLMADMIVNILGEELIVHHPTRPPGSLLKNVDEVIPDVLTGQTWFWAHEILCTRETPPELNEAWIQGLDTFGRTRWREGFVITDTYRDLLAEVWRIAPTAKGLVLLAAHIAQYGNTLPIPTELDVADGENDTELQIAYLILQVVVDPLSLVRSKSRVARLLSVDPTALTMLLRAISVLELSPGRQGQLLLELQEIVPGQQAGEMVRALRDVVRRRRSRLSEPSVWTSLGFPVELASLLEP